MLEGLSGGCRAGLPLRGGTNRLSTGFSRSVEMRCRFGWRMLSTRCASCMRQLFGALREEVARERQVALSSWKAWKGAAARTASVPWHTPSGELAPDSARLEGSSIVD